MPLYEYRCKACGHVFEKIQSFSAPEEKECPVCKGEVERLISAPAIQFKGSGWYVSDYAGKSAAGKAGSTSCSDSSSTSATPSTTKSESAPATPASSSSSGTGSAGSGDAGSKN